MDYTELDKQSELYEQIRQSFEEMFLEDSAGGSCESEP